MAMAAEALLKLGPSRLSLFPARHEPSNLAAAPAGMDGQAESFMATMAAAAEPCSS